ncbi:putative adhesin [Lentzea sp. E54]|uniref:putative adhesin n=1 Tax=Lentzea xerophila TaxID=3435883 RepID=UPI003DA62556
MVAYVFGHGERALGRSGTFVPSGRSLAFLAPPGDFATMARAAEVIWSGGDTTGLDVVTSRVGTPCAPIPNYTLSPLADHERAVLTRVIAEAPGAANAEFYWVGADVPAGPYCTARCRAAEREHRKDCHGFFNVVSEPDVITINCRAVRVREVLGALVPFVAPNARQPDAYDDVRAAAQEVRRLVAQRRHLDAWQALQRLSPAARALVEASDHTVAEFVRAMSERAAHATGWMPDHDQVGVEPFRQGEVCGDLEVAWTNYHSGTRATPPLPAGLTDCLAAWQNVFLAWLQDSSDTPLALYHLVLLATSERRAALHAPHLDEDASTPAALYALSGYVDDVHRLWCGPGSETVLVQLGLGQLTRYPDELGALVDELTARWAGLHEDSGLAEAYFEGFAMSRSFVDHAHDMLLAAFDEHVVPLFRAALSVTPRIG